METKKVIEGIKIPTIGLAIDNEIQEYLFTNNSKKMKEVKGKISRNIDIANKAYVFLYDLHERLAIVLEFQNNNTNMDIVSSDDVALVAEAMDTARNVCIWYNQRLDLIIKIENG